VLPLEAARADTASASLQVSVHVLPHVRLQSDDSPVAITVGDIERGYHDVSRRYTVVTNEPDRLVLQLNPRVGLTDRVEIAGLQAPLHMAESSLEVAPPHARNFTLSYRLWLSAVASPGEYALPVQVAALIR
jgi:hypothetical protein